MKIMVLLIMALLSSCSPESLYKTGRGFWHPWTISLEVPPGPPEFQQGWRDGCNTAVGFGRFKNSKFGYSPAATKGLTGNASYQAGWNVAWPACVIHSNIFVTHGFTLEDSSGLSPGLYQQSFFE